MTFLLFFLVLINIFHSYKGFIFYFYEGHRFFFVAPLTRCDVTQTASIKYTWSILTVVKRKSFCVYIYISNNIIRHDYTVKQNYTDTHVPTPSLPTEPLYLNSGPMEKHNGNAISDFMKTRPSSVTLSTRVFLVLYRSYYYYYSTRDREKITGQNNVYEEN